MVGLVSKVTARYINDIDSLECELAKISQGWFRLKEGKLGMDDRYSAERYLSQGCFVLLLAEPSGDRYLLHPRVGVSDSQNHCLIHIDQRGEWLVRKDAISIDIGEAIVACSLRILQKMTVPKLASREKQKPRRREMSESM